MLENKGFENRTLTVTHPREISREVFRHTNNMREIAAVGETAVEQVGHMASYAAITVSNLGNINEIIRQAAKHRVISRDEAEAYRTFHDFSLKTMEYILHRANAKIIESVERFPVKDGHGSFWEELSDAIQWESARK